MAKLGISTGTTPNDGTGDTLLGGAEKINSNFNEIYTLIGDGTNLSTPVTSIIAGDNISISGSTGAVTITGLADTSRVVANTVTVSGVVTASSFTGSAAGLTDIPSIQLTGTINDARLPSTITSDITGNVTGNLTGNVTGNLTGNVTGNVSGTAGTFTTLSGNGESLTGVVTSIVAGTNITLTGGPTGIVTINSLGGSTASFASVAGIATYTSEWTLGADGFNHYTFTGPGFTGAENDPPLYLTRGQQYKFTNNMNAHPFRIQSTPNGSAGTQYNDGIPTNNVSNGTLTWDVQFDAPNILYYQCTAHPNMGGPIYIIPRSEPAVGVRTDVSGTTGSVGAGLTTNLDITGFKSYGLLKVGISSAAWVRLYVDEASRTSDASRSHLTDPSPGSGLIAEVRSISTGSTSFLMTPGVIGWNNDVSVGSTIYSAVTNNESVSSTLTVDLTVVKLED